MFRAAASVARRTALRSSRTGLPSIVHLQFHASSKREEEAKPVEATEKQSSWWDPVYSIPLGIAMAVPAIHYEWYLVNEETQLAACFMAFCMIIHKQFGNTIYEALEEDGKRILEEHNKIEDQVIDILENKLYDLQFQKDIVTDAQDVLALKEATYQKLHKVGQIKPLYDFKAQMERLLSGLVTEEAALREKAKVALMEEATMAVMAEFASSKALKTTALNNSIAQLKGGKGGGSDPVKDAYIQFFKNKAKAAEKVDEAAEAKETRQAIAAKLNALAMNEEFYFKLDGEGKPEMVV